RPHGRRPPAGDGLRGPRDAARRPGPGGRPGLRRGELPGLRRDAPGGPGRARRPGAGAGAEALGFAHLDSGALYRGVTLVALREAALRGHPDANPLDVVDPETILRTAEDWGLTLHQDGHGFAAYLQGEPVDQEIRSPQVTAYVSAVAAVPVVRE